MRSHMPTINGAAVVAAEVELSPSEGNEKNDPSMVPTPLAGRVDLSEQPISHSKGISKQII